MNLRRSSSRAAFAVPTIVQASIFFGWARGACHRRARDQMALPTLRGWYGRRSLAERELHHHRVEPAAELEADVG